MKHDLRYTPTDVYETFPLPVSERLRLDEIGEEFHSLRTEILHEQLIGLTELYNRFHDPTRTDPKVQRLRALQIRMDEEVCRAYGWQTLTLDHGFVSVPYRPESDRLRFTVSENARKTLLASLADLNRQRFRDGVKGTSQQAIRSRTLESAGKHNTPDHSWLAERKESFYGQRTLNLDEDLPKVAELNPPYVVESDLAKAIRVWLSANPGWHTKEQIIAGTSVRASDLFLVMTELVEHGGVVTDGGQRRRKYRAQFLDTGNS
jgi:hypothetical protein